MAESGPELYDPILTVFSIEWSPGAPISAYVEDGVSVKVGSTVTGNTRAGSASHFGSSVIFSAGLPAAVVSSYPTA